MKRVFRIATMVFAFSGILLLAGCDSLLTEDDNDGGGGGSGGVGSLLIVNNSSYTIFELYVTPSTSSTWGSDQLPGSIAPGSSFTLTSIPAGVNYDLLAESGSLYWRRDDVFFSSGGSFTWTLVN